MTPERQAEFDEASKPFIDGGGAIKYEHTKMMPWRVFLEVGSACNLHCPSCTKGNVEGYEHKNGFMDFELMERILDKIKSENPNAIVFTYGNSEPFLHPKLPECIAAIKARGLHPELSTNLNFIRRVEDLLDARPDLIIISLSGFTQDVYVKGHAGGDIEKVKANMKILGEANASRGVPILVNYHIYKDNGHELEQMREYAASCGIGLFTSYARAISMENAIQYCRSRDPDAVPFEVRDGHPDYNHMLPPVGQTYVDVVERMFIPPTEAVKMYEHLPAPAKTCPIGTMFTFVRHDGKTEMCACVADRRLILGDYLETSQDKLAEQRENHPICQQCSRYKLRYYFHIQGKETWIDTLKK